MCKNKVEFTELVAEYRKLSAQKKKTEDALKVVKADMEDYIKAKGTPGGKNGLTLVVFGDGYKVSLIPIENPVFDSEKLKALLGEHLAEYQKSNCYSKIDVR
jgi:hypothetical protein